MENPYQSTDLLLDSALRHFQQNAYPQKSVYLCGPITGLSYSEARHTWREAFASMLPPHIHPLSPMRAKEFLEGQEDLKGGPTMYENPLGTSRGIVTRDSNDLRTADAVVACFLGAEKVSIGSMWELGFASAIKKPIILVMERDCELRLGTFKSVGGAHCHAFVTESAGYWVETLEEAAAITTHLLTPGV